jgi:lysophospholipase L1-like esterase
VDLALPDGSDVAISVSSRRESRIDDVHGTVPYASYVSRPEISADRRVAERDHAAVLVLDRWSRRGGSADTGAIVAVRDSITDGVPRTPETNGSWPSVLAARLRGAGAKTAVLNVGISGNRVLHDGAGVNALARFDSDVLAQPGVRTLIVLEGINDIGFPNIPASFFGRGGGANAPDPKADEVSAEEIIGGLRQLIERAHIHGLKVIGGTLTPYEAPSIFSPAGERNVRR